MTEFLQTTYWDNTVLSYLIAAGIILLGFLIVRMFRNKILNRLKKWSEKTENTIDDYVVAGVERFGLPILNFGIFYVGIRTLHISPFGEKVLHALVVSVLTFYAVKLVSSTIRLALESYTRKQEGGEEKVKQLKGVMVVFNILLWSLGLVFLFSNLGYDVTAIITGMGIGGIAIALAAQNILGDLFNYFVIFFDRPFEIGDLIVVDNKTGHVEYIGIKTTRLKSLSGEQIIISNSDLTNSRVHNFKRLERRRIVFTLGVTYQTSAENLKIIPDLIRTIIIDQPDAEIDRCHFANYGDFSLNFETVYFVNAPDYVRYMDIQQAINLRIFEEFTQRGISFAYPTQTLFIEKP